MITAQKNFAKIWIDELVHPGAIKKKIREAKKQKMEYIKQAKMYQWNKKTIKENINAYDVFIKELEKAL